MQRRIDSSNAALCLLSYTTEAFTAEVAELAEFAGLVEFAKHPRDME